jgi:K+/H+ antiporter YhaU regulatory subunit KhtT
MSLKDYIYGQTFYGIEPENQLICVPVKVDSDSIFQRKSIKNSRIREQYSGRVIGIERDDLPIINPDIGTIILQGDLLWILGTKKTADSLIKKDILKESGSRLTRNKD